MPDRRLVWRAAAGATLVLALIAGAATWNIREARRMALHDAQARADLMARAFGAHAEASLGWIDASMLDLDRAWTSGQGALEDRARQVAAQLGELVFQITTVGPDGVIRWSTTEGRASSRIDLSDREHIRVHVESRQQGTFISAPVLGRVSKKWSIQFSRAVRRDGVLHGILVFSVAPEHFARFYASLPLERNDVIAMVRGDGTTLVRAPADPAGTVRRLSNAAFVEPGAPDTGVVRRISQVDGEARIYAYRRLPASGLTVLAGLSERDALAAADVQARWMMAGAGSIALATLLLAWMAVRAIRGREARAVRLREDNVRLENAVAERTRELQVSRSAMDAAAEGIVIADATRPDLPLVYVNDAFERLTGYSRAEVLGRNCRFLHRHDPAQPALEALRAAIRAGTPARVELRNVRKDGTPFLNLLSIAPLRDATGRVTHFVGIQNDVTERSRLEAQLRETQKMDAIGQLTGGLAHDFNNLLGVVVGNLDLIGEQLPAGGDLAERHRVALEAALRGAEVTRALLAVARRQPLKVERHDLNGLLSEMLPLARSSAGSAITVRAELAGEPLVAPLDASGLSSAVLNLVINARDALAEACGDRQLVLRTRAETVAPGTDPQLAGGRYAVLEIQDNGAGMPADVAARAFEPFFTTKETGRGTGLGLSMVRGFAEQLGGTARIESRPGQGTTVRVYLPLEAPAA